MGFIKFRGLLKARQITKSKPLSKFPAIQYVGYYKTYRMKVASRDLKLGSMDKEAKKMTDRTHRIMIFFKWQGRGHDALGVGK